MASSFNIIHSMSYKRLLLLASGVACLFGIIGPLNILMLSPEKNPSWTAVFLMTFFSGASAFCILALFRKLYIAIPAVLLCFLGSFSVGSIEEFLTGSRTIERPWITVKIGNERPEKPIEFTAEQLKSLQRKREYVGFLAICLLGVGYALVITAITQEGRVVRGWQQRFPSRRTSRNHSCRPRRSEMPGARLRGLPFRQPRSGEITLTLLSSQGILSPSPSRTFPVTVSVQECWPA